MKFLRKYADNTSPDSVSNRFRKKRFSIFLELIKDLPKPVKILDIGGTKNFWLQMGLLNDTGINLTIINIEDEKINESNIKFIKADARDLSIFSDKEFDIVFSNSVIEHFNTKEDQLKMAMEVLRTGKKHYVQTPNYYFPFEPHYLFPCFQFLPNFVKVFLLMHFKIGWFEKMKTREEALKTINSIRLLKIKDLNKLFPNSKIIKEKFLFLTKSFIAISV